MIAPQPTRPHALSPRGPLLAAAILLLPAAAYAFWPLPSSKLSSTTSQAVLSQTPTTSAPTPLNLAAFRVPLWVAPIPPPTPPPPSPPPPPLKLQLIAIARDSTNAALSATLFDPDTGKILTVAEGQPIGTRTLTRITPTTIEIKDAAGTRILSLRAESPQGGAP